MSQLPKVGHAAAARFGKSLFPVAPGWPSIPCFQTAGPACPRAGPETQRRQLDELIRAVAPTRPWSFPYTSRPPVRPTLLPRLPSHRRPSHETRRLSDHPQHDGRIGTTPQERRVAGSGCEGARCVSPAASRSSCLTYSADDASSDEHFSDASEGHVNRNEATSPIPITRVERVDDEPAHGEVPGTDAYLKRTQDAVPDEVEIVPDGSRSRSASRVSISDRPLTPGGTPVPKTIVEKIDPDEPSYGDVPGTHAHQLRLADAEPDVIVKAPEPPQRKTEGT
jgi:hypothetical protein